MRTISALALALGLVAGPALGASPRAAASASATASATIVSPETIRLGVSASSGVAVDTDRAAGFLSVGRWVDGTDAATVRVPAEGKPLNGSGRRVIDTDAKGDEQPRPLVLFYHHY